MRRGIFFMLAAMTAFILNDTCVKLASEDLPTGQIIFIRGLIAMGRAMAPGLREGSYDEPHRAPCWP